MRFVLIVICLFCVFAGAVFSGAPSMLERAAFESARGAVLDLDRSSGSLLNAPGNARRSPSLFYGREGQSLFAIPPRALAGRGVAGLRTLIASVEAGEKGYNAVNYGARILPPKPPTQLTIAEIRHWNKSTPGQPHAIGRYQLIPPTFERLVRQLGLKDTDRFSPEVQDLFADALLEEAGLSNYVRGEMRQTNFMNNLAKIWAGLPNATGRSHYHGFAGNKAVISWDAFRNAMDEIFPRG